MNRVLIISSLCLLSVFSFGQVDLTFQLDIENLKALGLFDQHSNDHVYVRGSFNNWTGTNHELTGTPNSNIYTGTFTIAESIGDTIYYKYVINKAKGNDFWEWQPEPSNPDNGNRQFIIAKSKESIPVDRFSYNEYFSYPVVFSKEKLQEDFQQFRNILESTHPALYDYTKKEDLDSLFKLNYSRIDSSLEFRDFLILMTNVISKVGCGHSSLWVPNSYWKVAPEGLFPLKLYLTEVKAWVTGDYDDTNDIQVGAEIISINDVPIQTIISQLTDLISADGFIHAYRSAKLGQHFSAKYAHLFGFHETFKIKYMPPQNEQHRTNQIAACSFEQIKNEKKDEKELSFNITAIENTGLLTINSFGYYDKVGMFHSFIDSVFQFIDTAGIENLILDLRGNSGGDPFCSAYLWAYLQPGPLAYFKDHYGKYDTLAHPLTQPKHHFTGNLFTLIDGHGFSTTGHFCGLLKYHNVGKFVGTELGSTYTCTGNATYPPLKNTGIMVGTARVRRYTVAVDGMDPKQGIIPDFPVEFNQEDIIQNNDPVLDFTLKHIANSNK